MSAFGYGESYWGGEPSGLSVNRLGGTTSPGGMQSAPPIGQGSSPQSSPAIPGFQMNQGPTQSWSTGNRGFNAAFGSNEIKGTPKYTGFLNTSSGKNPFYYSQGGNKGYWANPLQSVFGVDPAQTEKYLRGTSYSGSQMRDYRERANPMNQNLGLGTPKTFAELNSAIGSLDASGLMNLDMNFGGVNDAFSQINQHYANAFANKNYAGGSGKIAEIQGTGLDRKEWTQGAAQNHLQDAYNSMIDSLNKAGLL